MTQAGHEKPEQDHAKRSCTWHSKERVGDAEIVADIEYTKPTPLSTTPSARSGLARCSIC